ncbi:SusC/RagA family TonB-linked outer membrane protein [Dysgonomonas macrotermitis]|uniref:TonB-linked outer membrane protein, SusC/RagA family n=1 Tax=Dysgonomonas macrotermitis TaxID=1346286 RepID=A0A1M4VPG1_9BACT|nr:TonB-dependent receptor [Dysgonomonas macrotermitis]SHE70765.1 TonB-linked outer membrane protein, SusC/RagA family [Dysgonomonas macrotermitis]
MNKSANTFTKKRSKQLFRFLVSFLFSTLICSALYGNETQQGREISGLIVSDSDREPLIGVSVSIKGTTTGTVTDIDGKYLINANEGQILVFSYLGFQNQEITVGNQQTINVVLKENTALLDEVVVVGYGVQKKKLITGATVQVKGDDVQKLNTTSVLGALQSMTPGVNIIANNGQPGEGYKFNIRGMGTTGDSTPLVVIDGVAGGDINSLSPADIESVDILKDAASAAIYGARAANGVMLITTKQGKAGKMQVTYDAYLGWQNVYKNPGLLNAREYMTIQDEIRFNEGKTAYNWENELGSKIYNRIQNGWNGTDWFDAIREKNATTQNHAINIIGGTDMSKFSAGFSYTEQNGILGKPVASAYERYTARLNSSHVLLKGSDRDIVTFGENITFYYSKKNGVSQGNIYYNDVRNVLTANPLIPLYNDEGEYYGQTDKDADGWIFSSGAGNPVMSMVAERGQNMNNNYGLNATAYLEVSPIKGLKYRGQFSYKMSSYNSRSFATPFKSSVNSSSTNYSVTQSAGTGHSIAVENTISYVLPKLGNHNIDVLVGQAFEKNASGADVSVGNVVDQNDALPLLNGGWDYAWVNNMTGSSTSNFSGSPWGDSSLASFFGRANWNYDEKYMATLTIRTDGSSNFARGKRWGTFPSVSVGWVMTNENWMEESRSWLDFLKIRGSWGQNGNCNIPNFNYLATVRFDKLNVYSFGSTSLGSTDTHAQGAYTTNLPNPDVTWETSEQLNLGIDARFLNSRLGLAFDYYVKTTKDWLIQAPILATAGTGAPYINGGDVENKGFEVALNWNDQIGKDFSYGANLNFSYNKNEVTRIANTEGIIHGDGALAVNSDELYRAQVGYPIGYFWGYKTAGVFQNQAEIDEWIANGNGVLQPNPVPGDLKFVDRNKDGVIDQNDKTQIGNPNPDFHLGLGLNFAYKGFDLSLTGVGVFGHQIAMAYRSSTTGIFERWHGEGTSNRFPRLSDESNLNWKEVSDIYIEKADYFRIQNVTLGYDFKKLFPRIPLQQARLYVQAQNLYTFTGYPGMDPEVGYGSQSWASGIDLGSYPSPRTILIGINLKY